MKNDQLKLTLTVFGLFTIVGTYFAYHAVLDSHDAAVFSTASSILIQVEDSGRIWPGGEWHEIPPDMLQLPRIDSSGTSQTKGNESVLDKWGHQFVVATEVGPTGQVFYKVASSGADGRLGTEDDIVVETHPERARYMSGAPDEP